MSPLIGHADQNDKALAILADIALHGKTPTRRDVVASGLDIELCESLVRQMNPNRHRMLGWEALENWFRTEIQDVQYVLPARAMLIEEKLRNPQFVHTHTRQILRLGMRNIRTDGGFDHRMPLPAGQEGRYRSSAGDKPLEEFHRVTELRVLYTKRGDWIVWVSWPESQFRECTSVRDMLQAVQDMTLTSMELFDLNKRNRVDSVPVEICNGLLKFQQESASRRTWLAEFDQQRTKSMLDTVQRFGLRPPS